MTIKNKNIDIFAAPLPPTIIAETLSSQLKKKTAKNATQSQRTKKTPAKPRATQKIQLEESQISRTQSTKRIKKNLKGETPLHLAVLNV